MKTHAFHHVAGLVSARESGADSKLHVRQEAMLRVPPAHADSTRIAGQNLDVDIAHAGIEGSGPGVSRPAARAAATPTLPTAAASKEHHVIFVTWVLIPGSVLSQHEHRALCPVPDQANRGPNVTRLRYARTAPRPEHTAFPHVL